METQMTIPGAEQPPDRMTQIMQLIAQLETLQDAILEQTNDLKLKLEAAKEISENKLPDLLNGLGLTEITTRTGKKMSLKLDTFAHISKDNADAAFGYLRAQNMAGIIKEEIAVNKDDAELLRQHGIPFALEQSIHPQTLKSFAAERLAADPAFPRELFGVYQVQRAVIKNA